MGEARLVEILEGVCSKSDEKCFEFLNDNEEFIEEWWAKRDEEDHDFQALEQHLCVEEAKVCLRASLICNSHH